MTGSPPRVIDRAGTGPRATFSSVLAGFAMVVALCLPEAMIAQEGSLNMKVSFPYIGNPSLTPEPVPLGHLTVIGCRFEVEGTGYYGSGWKYEKNVGISFQKPWKLALIVDGQVVHLDERPKTLKVWFPYYSTKPDFWTTWGSGVKQTVEVDWLPTQPGTHDLRCSLDVGHVVKESVESDNSKAIQFAVQGPLVAAPDPGPLVINPGAAAAAPPEKAAGRARRGNPRTARAAPSPTIVRGFGTQVFTPPKWNGKRVDLCLVWGGQCGEPAATEFCKRSGYAKVTAWKPAHDIGAQTPTVVLSSGQVCSDMSCDGFASITCSE